MKNEKKEALFQISFFLAILFFSLSWFLISNIFLFFFCFGIGISIGFIVMLIAVLVRANRKTDKAGREKVLEYL